MWREKRTSIRGEWDLKKRRNYTHGNGELLSEPRGDESEHKTSDGNAQPEACGCHTGREGVTIAHTHHEGDDPAA